MRVVKGIVDIGGEMRKFVIIGTPVGEIVVISTTVETPSMLSKGLKVIVRHRVMVIHGIQHDVLQRGHLNGSMSRKSYDALIVTDHQSWRRRRAT